MQSNQRFPVLKKNKPLEAPVDEAYKEEEDDDLIFRKMSIPWL